MNRNLWLKMGIIAFIIGVTSFSDWTFAEENDVFEIMGWSLSYIISVLSRIWVFFAKLAGTFLTNKRVYGEIFGFDALFWKFWNIMKNIANFGLGFYFVYVIGKGLISQGKEDITKNLKKIILWLLIGGIGIQSSRFLTAAVIDLSTITLAAAGAFPSQIISDSNQVELAMKTPLSEYLTPNWEYVDKGKRISLFSKDAKASSFLKESSFEIVETQTFTGFIENLLPNPEDVSGPLYFMGLSILKTYDLNSINSSDNDSLKATILNLIIQGGTTVVFSIEMFVLCVLALIRIIYLRMFIILSPLAVLIRCIQKSGEKFSGGDDSFLTNFTKQINLKTFLVNVFKPTIIVLGIGLTVIFVSLMKKVIVDNNDGAFNYQGTTFYSVKDKKSNIQSKGDQTYTTMVDNGLLNFTLAHVGKTLLDIILSIITVIIVYLIIKFAISLGGGKDFVSTKIGKIQKGVGDLLGSVPVVPVAGYDKAGKPVTHFISAGKTFGITSNGLELDQSLIGKKIERYQGKVDEFDNEQSSLVNSRFNNNMGYLTAKEKLDIQNVGKSASMNGIDKLKRIREIVNGIKTEEGKGMTLNLATASNDGLWIEEFTKWLNERAEKGDTNGLDTGWRNMINYWKNPDSNKSLDKLFGKTEHVQTYAKYFFDKSDNRSKISTWEQLKNADISKK